MSKIITVTAATDYPVTLSEAREQCALIDGTYYDDTHDSLLTRLIKAATKEVENFTGLRMMQQTVRQDMDDWGGFEIPLDIYPVQSVSSVKYDDIDAVEQTVTSSDYYTELGGMSPRIHAVNYWPYALNDKPGSVRITLVVGYSGTGDSPLDRTNIPDDLRHAVLVRVYELWTMRGDGSSGGRTISDTVRALAGPYRLGAV